ncbi:hypothetical protein [Saccharopolyspora hattusasensis]|uniref:hypothetical protein n=1 Tax=Saccharopolyspora hattusasensis TaxID=1128679 RepID=UPI003D98078B
MSSYGGIADRDWLLAQRCASSQVQNPRMSGERPIKSTHEATSPPLSVRAVKWIWVACALVSISSGIACLVLDPNFHAVKILAIDCVANSIVLPSAFALMRREHSAIVIVAAFSGYNVCRSLLISDTVFTEPSYSTVVALALNVLGMFALVLLLMPQAQEFFLASRDDGELVPGSSKQEEEEQLKS